MLFVSCAQEKTREGKGAHKNQLLSLRKGPFSFEGLLGFLGDTKREVCCPLHGTSKISDKGHKPKK